MMKGAIWQFIKGFFGVTTDSAGRVQVKLFSLLFLLYFITIAFFMSAAGLDALNEINARESFLAYLKGKNQELSIKIQNISSRFVGETGASAEHSAVERNKAREELSSHMQTMHENGQAIDSIFSLMSQGTNHPRMILPCITGQLSAYPEWEKLCALHAPIEPFAPLIRYASNGVLMGLLVIVSAMLGSAVYSIREGFISDEVLFFSNIVSGFGAGIVCFLALQGDGLGTISGIETSALNPSTKVLFGFIAGLYSSNLYTVLTRLVQALVAKVAPDGASPPGGGGSPVSPQPSSDSGAPVVARGSTATAEDGVSATSAQTSTALVRDGASVTSGECGVAPPTSESDQPVGGDPSPAMAKEDAPAAPAEKPAATGLDRDTTEKVGTVELKVTKKGR